MDTIISRHWKIVGHLKELLNIIEDIIEGKRTTEPNLNTLK